MDMDYSFIGANLHRISIEAVLELWTEQRNLSRLQRNSTVIGKQYRRDPVLIESRENLNIGGNTDCIVRPKLIITST